MVLDEERMETERSKLCHSCGVVKLFSEYYKCKTNTHGIQSRCKLCISEANRKQREANPDYNSKYYLKHSEIIRARAAKYAEDNREYVNATKKLYREANAEAIVEGKKRHYRDNKDKVLAKTREWYKANPELHRAYGAKRRAAKLKRTPAWLTEQDQRDIEDFYYLAKALTEITGIPHVVDHILPLQGKLVSGLHHPANLQILTESENASKGNKFKPS
jgi:hypothetical protein